MLLDITNLVMGPSTAWAHPSLVVSRCDIFSVTIGPGSVSQAAHVWRGFPPRGGTCWSKTGRLSKQQKDLESWRWRMVNSRPCGTDTPGVNICVLFHDVWWCLMYEAVGLPGNLLSGSGPSFLGPHRSRLPRAEKVDMPQQKRRRSPALVVESWMFIPLWQAEVLAFTQ